MPNSNSEQPDGIQTRRMKQHRAATERAFALALRKNLEYGDSIARCGVLGCACELDGISSRVWALTKRAMRSGGFTDEIREALTDKALDAINYGAWLLALMEDDNLDGEKGGGAAAE